MTTAMNAALRAAGVHIPQNKRIWMWVKDHPNHTASEIGVALKIAGAAVAGYLRDMEARGMVSYTEATRRVRVGGKTKTPVLVDRKVAVWTVTSKLQEFDLLPKPKKAKPKKAAPVERDTPVQKPAALVKPDVALPEPKWTPQVAVEKLSLLQCRELYKFLREMFTV